MQVVVLSDDIVWAYNEQRANNKTQKIGFYEGCNAQELQNVVQYLSKALQTAQDSLDIRTSNIGSS
jgi:hypothetical protein